MALLGPGRHLLSLDEARAIFVESFDGDARLQRFNLFAALNALVLRLEQARVCCELWIDGSFATAKSTPDDIDLSVMVDADVYDALEPDGKSIVDEIAFCEGRYLNHLDAFVCIVYPQGSAERDLDPPEEWAKQWSVEHNERYLKGFAVLRIGL